MICLRDDDEAYLSLTLSTNINDAIRQFATADNDNYDIYLLEVTDSEKYFKFPYNGKNYLVIYEDRVTTLDAFYYIYNYKDAKSSGWRYIDNFDKLPENDGSTFSIGQSIRGTIIVKDKKC